MPAILYVPVETRVRELNAKILFSLIAVKAGFQVVIGPKWLFGVNHTRLPRGTCVFKTLNKMDAPAIAAFKQAGHLAVAWDDEGAGQITPQEYLRNIDADAIAGVDTVFSWGGQQTRMLADRYPAAAAKIATHGNPRWDLLRPEWREFHRPEVDALRARFGRYILINTNFSFYNAVFEDKIGGVLKIATRTGAFAASNPDDMGVLQDLYTFEKTMFAAYSGLIPKLGAAFPDHKIIVRPHPLEKLEYWHERMPEAANVVILHEGSVIPWIMGADTVLQTGCTTGFEALTLGRPVISYTPFASRIADWHLANLVCPNIGDDQALIDHMRSFVADPGTFAPFQAKGMGLLAEHIARLEGETASSAIVGAIGRLTGADAGSGFPLDIALADYPRSEYLAKKFPPLSAGEFVAIAQRLIALDPSLGNATADQIAESCFLLKRQ